MNQKNNGGAAFPLKEALTSDNEGMSLHSHFAGCAIQGLLANPAIIDSLDQGGFERLAIAAGRIANFMVERAK